MAKADLRTTSRGVYGADPRRSVLVYSGGMDSTTLMHELLSQGHDLTALSFDYGQRHRKEIEYAARNAEAAGIPHHTINIDLSFISSALLGSSPIPDGSYTRDSIAQTIVPFRNGIMLAYAVAYAATTGALYVYLGAHSGDHEIYPDCRPRFLSRFSDAAASGTMKAVRVIAPYRLKTKREIAAIGRALGVDYTHTWSCYRGGAEPCGKCSTCTERAEALDDR